MFKDSVKNICLILFLVASTTFAQQSFNKEESLSLIKNNVEVLASEEFEGRETGTKGEILASEFIASKLEEYGLKPFGDDGT
ncbi:MAG TPA: hypothetical protein VH917_06870, partial [Ignavibacteriaceae bacterium]